MFIGAVAAKSTGGAAEHQLKVGETVVRMVLMVVYIVMWQQYKIDRYKINIMGEAQELDTIDSYY